MKIIYIDYRKRASSESVAEQDLGVVKKINPQIKNYNK